MLFGGLQALALAAACSNSAPTATAGPNVTGGSGSGGGGAAGQGGGGGAQETGTGGGGGSSGSGGAGGATPAKQFPPLGLPAEVAWLDDPEVWSLLPQPEVWDERCYMRQADPDGLQYPPLRWESCGEGCARADVLQGHGDFAAYPVIGTSVHAGGATAFLHFAHAAMTTSAYRVKMQRSVDLESGLTVAAVQAVVSTKDNFAWCSAGALLQSGLASSGARSFDQEHSLHIRGSWDLREVAWRWQLPWPEIGSQGFNPGYCDYADMDEGGRSFYFCGGIIRAALTPGSSAITVLDRPSDSGFRTARAAALGDLLIWSEIDRSAPGSRVRFWKPDGRGIRTAMQGIEVDTCSIGLSSTHVAGFSTANACATYQDEGRFWIAERTEDGTLANLRLGPVFWPRPVVDASGIATWGDYAAMVWVEEVYENLADRRRLLLARTTDWAMRDIRGIEGHEVWAAGLTDQHLYVVYTLPGAHVGKFSAVYRYDLDKFDSIGQPIVPVE